MVAASGDENGHMEGLSHLGTPTSRLALAKPIMARHNKWTPQGQPHPAYPDSLAMPKMHERQFGFTVEAVHDFVKCLRDGKSPPTCGKDGLPNTQLLLAAERSADDCGAPVEV